MNAGFTICTARVGNRCGVCALDGDYPANLITVEYFFQLTIPLEVTSTVEHRLVRACPMGSTVFSVGHAKVRFFLGREEFEGRFEVVADPNLEKINGFDMVVSPTQIKTVTRGCPQGARCSPTLFEMQMAATTDSLRWPGDQKREWQEDAVGEMTVPTLKKLKRQ